MKKGEEALDAVEEEVKTTKEKVKKASEEAEAHWGTIPYH